MAIAMIAESILTGTAASFNFTSIPATYDHLMFDCCLRTNRSGQDNDFGFVALNNDTTTANYDSQNLSGANTTNTAAEALAAGNSRQALVTSANASGSNVFSYASMFIPFYAGSTFKMMLTETMFWRQRASGFVVIQSTVVGWASTVAVNQVTFTPQTGPSFVSGSRVTLYGIGA